MPYPLERYIQIAVEAGLALNGRGSGKSRKAFLFLHIFKANKNEKELYLT